MPTYAASGSVKSVTGMELKFTSYTGCPCSMFQAAIVDSFTAAWNSMNLPITSPVA